MAIQTEEKYLEMIKRKTGVERLKIAAELRKLSIKLAEAEVKSRKPSVSLSELKKIIQKRIYGYTFPFENGSRKTR